MRINIIAALGNDYSIGNSDGSLPWKQKNDMIRFKTLTTGNAVIMGRKTADTFLKPLPNRLNIVLSKNPYSREGFLHANNIQESLELVNDNKYKSAWIIGGSEIYKQFISFADNLYLTYIDATPNAEIKFQPDLKKFIYTNELIHIKDENNQYDYKFVDYIRLM